MHISPLLFLLKIRIVPRKGKTILGSPIQSVLTTTQTTKVYTKLNFRKKRFSSIKSTFFFLLLASILKAKTVQIYCANIYTQKLQKTIYFNLEIVFH